MKLQRSRSEERGGGSAASQRRPPPAFDPPAPPVTAAVGMRESSNPGAVQTPTSTVGWATRANEEQVESRDRYRELLEELRTVIPGAQVLLAFLLAVPFTNTFGELDEIGRDVFAAVLLGTALATIPFMTPAAYHASLAGRTGPPGCATRSGSRSPV